MTSSWTSTDCLEGSTYLNILIIPYIREEIASTASLQIWNLQVNINANTAERPVCVDIGGLVG